MSSIEEKNPLKKDKTDMSRSSDIKTDKYEHRLISGFMRSLNRFPGHPALVVNNETFSYRGLGQIAADIAAAIVKNETGNQPLSAILAYRSITAYAGILGILISGKGYVPLNPRFPLERTYRMFSLSKSNVLIVGKECIQTLRELLPKLSESVAIILPDTEKVDDLRELFPNHNFVVSGDIPKSRDIPQTNAEPEDIAYLLFTSGSTGVPKGVPVNNKNVASYIEYISRRYDIDEHDRFSQAFDMTFDLSVHDMFVCWKKGACLYCIPEQYVMAPAKFIRDKQLTMWFSVPSVGMFMSKMRMLKPNSFPSLRYSLFCGEPLSATLTIKWQEAAPNSVVENLYGPTEATIAITHYKWDSKKSLSACLNGIVPIGWIFQKQRSCIVDQELNLVPEGEPGELCLSGSQVTKHYFDDPERTREQYIKLPVLGDDIWYRTGDLVKQDKDGCLYYLSRIDNQVQILGYRVELQEVDTMLRKASDSEMVVSVAWPVSEGCAEGIVAFICKDVDIDVAAILDSCRKFLPKYMVPKQIYVIEKFPLNANGKIDRLKLIEMLPKEN